MGIRKDDGRGPAVPLIICALTIPVLFLMCNPFIEMGANDDWQYARMAKAWAETGRLQYDGWGQPMVGPHAAWGMAVIKVFGFSFSALRASMVPIGTGCAVLMYLIAWWVGLSKWTSALASLLLTLSPLFVPLATTFMTDVSSLLLFLATAYCVMRQCGGSSDAVRGGSHLRAHDERAHERRLQSYILQPYL